MFNEPFRYIFVYSKNGMLTFSPKRLRLIISLLMPLPTRPNMFAPIVQAKAPDPGLKWQQDVRSIGNRDPGGHPGWMANPEHGGP
jgi:hypothetical protein